jgi:hypothetical protein
MTRFQRGALVGLLALMIGGLIDLLLRRSWVMLLASTAIALVLLAAPYLLIALGSAMKDRFRQSLWSGEEGRHHNFGGIGLRIEHDLHYSWIAGSDLQRVLGTRDAEDVLAARLAGHWRRDDRGVLMLRIDAVVAHLASMPGRMEPRTVRLRRYFEREVLFPAAQRRARR